MAMLGAYGARRITRLRAGHEPVVLAVRDRAGQRALLRGAGRRCWRTSQPLPGVHAWSPRSGWDTGRAITTWSSCLVGPAVLGALRRAARRAAFATAAGARQLKSVSPTKPPGAGAGRDGEDGRPDVADVLVEHVGRQRALERDELLRRALEREEEEPGVEAAELVVAVDEVVAATQDAGCRRCATGARGERGPPDRSPADRATSASKSGSVNSSPPLSGAPSPLVRPMIVCCSARRTRSHDSISIGILRATRYEPPAIHAGRSPDRDPDVLLERGGVLGEDVGGAVLEPEEVARRLLLDGRPRGAAEAHLRPADARAPEGDPAQVAHGVHGDLRIVGARLDAEVAVAPLGLQVVAEEGREPLEPGRAPVRRCRTGRRRRSRTGRAEAEGDRQPVGATGRAPRPCRPAAPRGRRRRHRSRSRRGPASCARRHTTSPAAAPRARRGRVRRHHVERREVQVVLHRRRDARLVRAEERVRRRGCRRHSAPAAPSSRGTTSEPPMPPERQPGRAGRGEAEHLAPRQPTAGSVDGSSLPGVRRSAESRCRCGRSALTARTVHGQLRERLGERVDEVGELPLVVVGELAVVHEAVGERTVRGERLLERGVAGVDLVDEGRALVALRLRRSRARARRPSSSPRRSRRSPRGRCPTTSPPRR